MLVISRTTSARRNSLSSKMRSPYDQGTVDGLVAEAEWIAAPILFLSSEEARYVTGTVLYVDGGYVMDGSLPGAKYFE